jgi:hypothetical protein
VQADLGDVGLAPHADLDLPLNRLRLIPPMLPDRVCRGQDPALVVLDHRELRGIPVDVGVWIEVASHRPLGQCAEHVDVRLVFWAVAYFHIAAPAPDHACLGFFDCHPKPPK